MIKIKAYDCTVLYPDDVCERSDSFKKQLLRRHEGLTKTHQQQWAEQLIVVIESDEAAEVYCRI